MVDSAVLPNLEKDLLAMENPGTQDIMDVGYCKCFYNRMIRHIKNYIELQLNI